MTESNDQAPHRAVIWLTAGVYELLPTGECSGLAVHRTEEPTILIVDGKDKEEAIKLLEQAISKLKQVQVQ